MDRFFFCASYFQPISFFLDTSRGMITSLWVSFLSHYTNRWWSLSDFRWWLHDSWQTFCWCHWPSSTKNSLSRAWPLECHFTQVIKALNSANLVVIRYADIYLPLFTCFLMRISYCISLHLLEWTWIILSHHWFRLSHICFFCITNPSSSQEEFLDLIE